MVDLSIESRALHSVHYTFNLSRASAMFWNQILNAKWGTSHMSLVKLYANLNIVALFKVSNPEDEKAIASVDNVMSISFAVCANLE